MVDYVAAVHRVKGLLERQRMGRLQYLDEWEWVSTKERKACAVCLRGFYFHRKHHCATCGEVVCSNCAPLRELDEPLDEHTLTMRVCSVCMAQAGSHQESSMISGVTDSDDGLETTTSTTNVGTETYVGGLRYPKHRGLRRGVLKTLCVARRRRRHLCARRSRRSDSGIAPLESQQRPRTWVWSL